VRTHTYQYKLTTPVPDSTPPEHRPNTHDGPFEPLGPGTPTSERVVGTDVEAGDQ
jgi:hypothetical protein